MGPGEHLVVVEGRDGTQSPQKLTAGLLEEWPVEEAYSRHIETPGHTRGAQQPVDEESQFAAAARRERTRRDSLRRWLLNGDDEPAYNEDDREFGA